jgi:uncharacterized membrane protein
MSFHLLSTFIMQTACLLLTSLIMYVASIWFFCSPALISIESQLGHHNVLPSCLSPELSLWMNVVLWILDMTASVSW